MSGSVVRGLTAVERVAKVTLSLFVGPATVGVGGLWALAQEGVNHFSKELCDDSRTFA